MQFSSLTFLALTGFRWLWKSICSRYPMIFFRHAAFPSMNPLSLGLPRNSSIQTAFSFLMCFGIRGPAVTTSMDGEIWLPFNAEDVGLPNLQLEGMRNMPFWFANGGLCLQFATMASWSSLRNFPQNFCKFCDDTVAPRPDDGFWIWHAC